MIGFLAFLLIAAVVGINVWLKIRKQKVEEEAERIAFENDVKKLREKCKGTVDGYQIAYKKCCSSRDFDVFYKAIEKDEDFWGGNPETVFDDFRDPATRLLLTTSFLYKIVDKFDEFGYCTNNPYVDFIRHYLKTRESTQKLCVNFNVLLDDAMEMDAETFILLFEKMKRVPIKFWYDSFDKDAYNFFKEFKIRWRDMLND